jgi:hypothetical protein
MTFPAIVTWSDPQFKTDFTAQTADLPRHLSSALRRGALVTMVAGRLQIDALQSIA